MLEGGYDLDALAWCAAGVVGVLSGDDPEPVDMTEAGDVRWPRWPPTRRDLLVLARASQRTAPGRLTGTVAVTERVRRSLSSPRFAAVPPSWRRWPIGSRRGPPAVPGGWLGARPDRGG
jgi:hypothetical protein